MTETRRRTVVRMVTYRLSAWLLTIVITHWLSGDLGDATATSTLIHVVLSVDYYLHERIWLRIRWGVRPEGS